MNYPVRIAINQPCGEHIKTSKRQNEDEIESRLSFASRVLQLLFQRRGSSVEQRAKSWPGREEPVPAPAPIVVPTSADRRSSASIIIPNSLGSSAPASMAGSTRTRNVRTYKASAPRIGSSEAEWRHRQTYCSNCDRLFFTSMSALSSGAGRFCSLDCKTNSEYVTFLQEAMVVEFDSMRSGSSASSLGEDDGS
ncbi:hypothetical protein ON010_g11048 [Phytophthora cinnamomi]|nr:hypothetical protein ON010_g11048 [Phytophthora cinnamomi]